MCVTLTIEGNNNATFEQPGEYNMAHALTITTKKRKNSISKIAFFYYKGKSYTKTVKDRAEGLKWRKTIWTKLDLIDVTGYPLERLVRECMEHKEGSLYWTINCTRGLKIKGARVGSSSTKAGYRQIMLHGEVMYYHRAVWIAVHGEAPQHQIDHIDHDRANNDIANLRDVPQSENVRNKKKQKNNTSGFTGIATIETSSGVQHRATIKCEGIMHYLGTFKAVESAILARESAKVKLGFTPSHGL